MDKNRTAMRAGIYCGMYTYTYVQFMIVKTTIKNVVINAMRRYYAEPIKIHPNQKETYNNQTRVTFTVEY